ncbi:hypothetical protein HYQ46_006615 [Verticillium longisporum]|nr:hypothetical protein HYQ46_006615 [Verticillium longisporum]
MGQVDVAVVAFWKRKMKTRQVSQMGRRPKRGIHVLLFHGLCSCPLLLDWSAHTELASVLQFPHARQNGGLVYFSAGTY